MKCPHCGKHSQITRRAVVVEHNGEPMSLRELAQAVGLPASTVIHRYARGWRGEKLIEPADQKYTARDQSSHLAGHILPGA